MYNVAIGLMIEQLYYGRIAIHIRRQRASAFLKLLAVMILGNCFFGAGCGSSNTIWKEQLSSPDGLWVASADSVQTGGFGSASIQTQVYLKSTDGSKPRKEVLGFSCEGPAGRPYVLDNVANKGGTIDLEMKWVSPSHLEVTYNGRASVNLRLPNYDHIEVSLKVAPTTSSPKTAP